MKCRYAEPGPTMGPGSAAHRHSALKTRVNALLALRGIRGTRMPESKKVTDPINRLETILGHQ